jgi:hypothetical protein
MRDFREQNYYELLDVKPHASAQELERSYQRARRYFSGESVATYALFQPDELTLLRRRIEEAYRVLSDPERRRRYDREIFGREDEDEERPMPVEEAQAALVEPVRDIVPEEEVEEAPQKFEPPEIIAEEVVEEEISEPPEKVDSIEDRIIRDEDAPAEPATPPPQTTEPHKTQEPPVDLPPQPQLPTMPPISEDTEFTGDLLRQVREARGLTLEQMANTTKIAIYYLRNLEAEEYGDLPAKVYVKGYLKQIARLLKLDAEPMVKSYTDRMEKPPEE